MVNEFRAFLYLLFFFMIMNDDILYSHKAHHVKFSGYVRAESCKDINRKPRD